MRFWVCGDVSAACSGWFWNRIVCCFLWCWWIAFSSLLVSSHAFLPVYLSCCYVFRPDYRTVRKLTVISAYAGFSVSAMGHLSLRNESCLSGEVIIVWTAGFLLLLLTEKKIESYCDSNPCFLEETHVQNVCPRSPSLRTHPANVHCLQDAWEAKPDSRKKEQWWKTKANKNCWRSRSHEGDLSRRPESWACGTECRSPFLTKWCLVFEARSVTLAYFASVRFFLFYDCLSCAYCRSLSFIFLLVIAL